MTTKFVITAIRPASAAKRVVFTTVLSVTQRMALSSGTSAWISAIGSAPKDGIMLFPMIFVRNVIPLVWTAALIDAAPYVTETAICQYFTIASALLNVLLARPTLKESVLSVNTRV